MKKKGTISPGSQKKQPLRIDEQIESNNSDEDVEEFTKSFMSRMDNEDLHLKSSASDTNDGNSESESIMDDDDNDDDSSIMDDDESSSCDTDLKNNKRTAKTRDKGIHQKDILPMKSSKTLRSVEQSNSSVSADSDSEKECSSTEKVSDDHHSLTSENDSVTDNEQDNVEDDMAALRKELSDLPFSELQKLKEKIGIKAYQLAMFGNRPSQNIHRTFSRKTKHRPMEMSSKKPVSRHRDVIKKKKIISRDPRFDDLSGEYKESLFKNSYSFLDDIRLREKKTLIKSLQKEKDEDKKKQIEYLIKRMSQQEKAEQQKEQQQERQRRIRKQERQLVQQGKNPYYLKKSEKKKLELAEKFQDLKKHGHVEKYMARKRKKNASKDRRHMPYRKT